MAASIGPNLGLSYGWTPRSGSTPGDSGWGQPMSANLKKLDAIFGLSVLSATATSPAVTTDGTRYIVPASGATGDFVGKANQVAVRVAGVWEFYLPSRGWLAENQATGGVLKFNGTVWAGIEVPLVYLDVSDTGGATLPDGSSFTKISMITVNEDTASAWNTGSSAYIPTTSGLYMIDAMVRPARVGADLMPAGTNLSIGFGPAAADGINVVAASSADLLPFTLSISKPIRLTAGTAYFLFGNHDAAAPIGFTHAQLKITRLGS